MNIKKINAFLLAGALVLGLCACSVKAEESDELNPKDDDAFVERTPTPVFTGAPDTPTITGVIEENGSAVITWEEVEHATSYQIFRRIRGEDWTLLQAVAKNVFSYTDETVDDKKYEYSVRAANNAGGENVASGFSSEVVFKVGGLELAAPVIVSAVRDGGSVAVTWDPVDGVTSYRVFRRIMGNDWTLLQAVAKNATSYVDADAGDTAYQYAVRAVNNTTEPDTLSEYSAAVSAG